MRLLQLDDTPVTPEATKKPCAKCGGSGVRWGGYAPDLYREECPYCAGTGEHGHVTRMGGGLRCPTCESRNVVQQRDVRGFGFFTCRDCQRTNYAEAQAAAAEREQAARRLPSRDNRSLVRASLANLSPVHQRLWEAVRDHGPTSGQAEDALLACPDWECNICGVIMCPHDDEMHYHHDGCPSCAAADRPQHLRPACAECGGQGQHQRLCRTGNAEAERQLARPPRYNCLSCFDTGLLLIPRGPDNPLGARSVVCPDCNRSR